MPNLETNVANAKQVIAGAELTLAAQKRVNLYRVVGVKMSNVTNLPCAYSDVEYMVATSSADARLQYATKNASKMQNDVVGTWLVSVIITKHGRSNDCLE